MMQQQSIEDWGKYLLLEFFQPPEVHTYNDCGGMGGVDHGDQIAEELDIKRRTRNWSLSLFWGLITILVLNVIVIWRSYDFVVRTSKKGFKTFKQCAKYLGEKGLKLAMSMEKRAIRNYKSKVKNGKSDPNNGPYPIFKRKKCRPVGAKGQVLKWKGLVSKNDHECTTCGQRRAEYQCGKCFKWACHDHIYVH